MATELTQKRIEILVSILENYGIEFDGRVYISLFEMAYNINNIWRAFEFAPSDKLVYDKIRPTVYNFDLCYMYRAIRDAVRKSDSIEFHVGSNKVEFISMAVR